MRKYLAAIAAIVLIPLSASAQPECAPGLIHYMPYCVTQAELEAMWVAAAVAAGPPTAEIAPAPLSVGAVERWRPLVVKYWPPHLVEWALRIIRCESEGDPGADNPDSSAAGLFQFLKRTWDRGPAPALGLPSYSSGAPYVAEWNIQAAAWLYANWGGTSQWTCKR